MSFKVLDYICYITKLVTPMFDTFPSKSVECHKSVTRRAQRLAHAVTPTFRW